MSVNLASSGAPLYRQKVYRQLTEKEFLFILRQKDVQNDRYERCRNNTGTAEDQLDRLRGLRQNGHIRAHAVADAESDRNDRQIARRHFLLGDQLDTADDDGREHHDRCAAEHRLRHDGNDRAELRNQAAENEEDRADGQRTAVDDLGHGDKADVLAERGVRENAEQRRERGTQTVAADAAGQLPVGRLAAHAALHNARNIAHRLNSGNDEHNEDRQDRTQVKDRLYRDELGYREPARLCDLVPVQHPRLGELHAVRIDCGRREHEAHDDSRDVAGDNADKDRGRAEEARAAVLDHEDHHEYEKCEQQIFHRAEVLRGVAAAEGIDADRDQRQADTQNDRAGDDRREKPAQRLEEEAEHGFKQTAENGRAHDRAVGDHAAAHRRRNAVEHADKARARAHDDRNLAADRADGEQLNERYHARNEHRVLKDADLKIRELAACNAARAHDDEQRREVADEHGENVLESERNSSCQRHFGVEIVRRIHRNSFILHTHTP